MSTLPKSEIVIVTTGASSNMRGADDQVRKLVEKSVSIEVLQSKFNQFLDSLQKILDVRTAQVGDFVLDEITFGAEISANGEFKLVGTGVGVSATSGMTFVLRRKPAGPEQLPPKPADTTSAQP